MTQDVILYYSSGGAAIKIIAVVVILIIRLAIRAGRSNSTTTTRQSNYTPQPPQQPSNTIIDPFGNPVNQAPQFGDNLNQYTGTTPTTGNNTHADSGAYCMYCGKRFASPQALAMDTCFKHPNAEMGLQKHVLYTGAGKPNVGF